MAFTHAHAVRSSYGRGTLPKTDRLQQQIAEIFILWNRILFPQKIRHTAQRRVMPAAHIHQGRNIDWGYWLPYSA